MTSEVQDHAIVARCGGESAKGSLRVIRFGEEARLKRALKAAGACLLIGCVCLCIPGAHFVLVPLTILLAPIVVYRVHAQRTKILRAEVACPKCHNPVAVLSSQELYPLFENCGSCHREVKIEPG